MTYQKSLSQPRSLLEALRLEQKWSRATAARRLGGTPAGRAYKLAPTENQLLRWEHNKTTPGPECVQALIELYRCDPSALHDDLHRGKLRHLYRHGAPGTVPEAAAGTPTTANDQTATARYAELRGLTELLGEGAEHTLGQLGEAHRDLAAVVDRSGVDPGTLATYEETIQDLELGLATGQPVVTLVADANHCLGKVRAHMGQGQPSRMRRQVYRAAAQLAAIIGRALAGAGAYLEAGDWLQTAQRAATEAGDLTLDAWVRVYRSDILYITGNHQALRRLAQKGQQLAARSGSAVTCARVASLEALAHALLGDVDGYRAARTHAEQAATHLTPTDRQIGPQRFADAEQTEILAHGAALLGLTDAGDLASDAVAQGARPETPSAVAWVVWQPHAQLDLAAAHITAGDTDQAMKLAETVMATTPDDRRAPVTRHLWEVLAALSAAGERRRAGEFADTVRRWAPPNLLPMLRSQR